MGTNFYIEEKTDDCCPCCGKALVYKQIHIGKRSAGWKFTFQKQPTKWESYTQFLNYVNSNKSEIIDEYGRLVDFKEFCNEIEVRQKDPDLLCHVTECAKTYTGYHGYKDKQGYGFVEGDFS
jgi:hypothetical protein